MSNTRSAAMVDRLEGLGPGELLALAHEAVRRAAGAPMDGADSDRLVASVAGWHRLGCAVNAARLQAVAAAERQQAYRGRAPGSVQLWEARLGLSRGEARALVEQAMALQRLPETAARHAQGLLGAGHVAEAARTVARLDRLTHTDGSEGDPEGPDRATDGVTGGADGVDGPGPGGEGERAHAAQAETLAALDALVAREADSAHGTGGRDGDGDGGRGVARQLLRRQLDDFCHQRAPELLADDHVRLRARRSLRLDRGHDHTPRVTGTLAPLTYAKARAMIHALARQHPAGDPRSFAQRCHDAFDRILDLAAQTGELPDLAGDQPRVLLVVHADTLHDRPGAPAATLDGYGPVDAATARQVCCDAETTTVAMNHNRRVLNVGRDRRQPNRAQRRAVFARDRACVGCGAPLAYCQIHHIRYWEHGGRTDVDNLVAVCWDCHQRIHHTHWRVQRQPDGAFVLRPPAPGARRGGIPQDGARPAERLAG